MLESSQENTTKPDLPEKFKKVIEEYQCPGCMVGTDMSSGCFASGNPALDEGVGCMKHHPGTIVGGRGTIWLGLPNGFNRRGRDQEAKVRIYENWSDFKFADGQYSKFNMVVWKAKHQGNVLLRVFQPRWNYGYVMVILDDSEFNKIPGIDVTEDMKGMD